MFYEPENRNHGLPYDPFKALIVPRPIGWISSIGADGSVNLAPYSYFNAVSTVPPIVMFSSDGEKDTSRNVRETGEFCCNFVTSDLLTAMSESSAPLPYGTSEFGATGLTPVPGRLVRAPYAKEAKAVLECRVTEILRPKSHTGRQSPNIVIFGEVVGVHIADEAIRNGLVDTNAIQPMARLGYKEYARIDAAFELERPPGGGDLAKIG
ncbi:MAG: flavin reductase family protein [Proteobacteria bacterium]|nr:flavin reductase family protein [Pseudomonadota bacterium]